MDESVFARPDESDAIALESAGLSLSYGELALRSNQLAHHLQRLGVGPERLVALELAPSPELVVALLAIWKAGGACLPIDRRLPHERRAWMLDDARPLLLLTSERLIDESAQIARQPEHAPAFVSAPETLAWVLYTSGSSGRPKGVAVERRGLTNLLAAQRQVLALGAGSRVLQFASPSFDACLAEIVMALGAGATLCFGEREALMGPALLDLLRERRITCVTLPPSLLAALPVEPLPELRDLFVAGERCGAEVVDRWAEGRRFLNLYGPTEAAVWATWARCRPGEPPTLGAPIPNVEIFLLDEQLREVDEGELCIGGAGVARGYWNLPRLTAERFVPFGGGRLFRTGDRARRLDGGALEFLGRRDRQVKVRGARVELDEIEVVLAEHPKVREAAVSAHGGGDLRLVAHVAGSATIEELRAHLARKLPEPMRPATWILVDALPRTASGKVDRPALPEAAPHAATALGESSTETERWLAGLWAELLQVPRVGLDDDFFELGGHSLTVTRLVARIAAARGVRLPFARVFEAPTVRALAAELAAAPSERRESPRAPSSERPLSSAEQRIFIAEQLDPGLPLFNAALLVRLRGAGNATSLQCRLDALVARHEPLRTTFVAGRARIAPAAPVPLPEVDLRLLDEAAREAELARIAAVEAQRPFDLAEGPLFRALAVRLAEDESALVLTLHHAVTDGASSHVLVRELLAPGGSPILSYGDFAAREINDLDYWRQRLAGAPPLRLPLDRPAPVPRTRRGGRVAVSLDRTQTRALRTLALHERATPFTALLAAWQALLARYSGQDDISVGAPLTMRSRVELEPLVGCFINLVVLRTNLGGRPSFRELLARARESVLGALAHGGQPYQELVAALSPDRRAPLFHVLFNFDEAAPAPLEDDGLRASFEELHNGTALYDLTLSLAAHEGQIAGHLEYDLDLFEPATAARLVDHFRALLAEAVDRPDEPLARLPLLGAAERRRLLVEWNGATRPSEFRAVHERFSDEAARHPDAPAVGAGTTTSSYAQLDRRANQVANHLLRRGLHGRPVAIPAHSSIDTCALVLGTLKAGGACVPIDPSHAERQAWMVAETGAAIVTLDACDAEREDPPPIRVAPDDAAYLLFTSGSTGRPKGVCLPHRALANLVAWQQAALPAARRTLQLAPLTFDVSFQELFTTWCSGGFLVLAEPAARRDPSLLGGLIAAQRIEHLFLPVVLLQQLAERFWDEPAPLASLREVFASGEPLAITGEMKRLFPALPHCRLHNHYGPTETHVVTAYTLPPSPENWPRQPPIGRPIDNARVYVLDSEGAPAPIGVAGELHLGGDCLARGYLDGATAGRFVPDRYGPAGARSYRTGDRACWRSDGQLAFLGRLDEQLKVRGFRVEPGEIEAALCAHDEVQTAVVVLRDDRLCAYVVPSRTVPPAARLAAHLAHRLPEPMIPSVFVFLEALPVGANGKLDRAALPPPPPPPVGPIEPRNQAERTIAEIWTQVLRLPRVGVEDDFFALGGHSLLAMQLATRISRAFEVKLLPRNVFEYPTVRRLAARIEELIVEQLEGGAG